MTEDPLPDFVIIGTQKCATTWIYRGLQEHPDISMPNTDAVNYFSMNYHRGDNWYKQFFNLSQENTIVGEVSRSYVRDDAAPRRLKNDLPTAKIIISIRNPMDRAYSHYWHEKSKGNISFEFNEVFENYDLFQNWVVPGFYYRHVQRFLDEFPEDQVKLVFFDDLVNDDETFIQDIYDFVGADAGYTPSFVDETVNEARDKLGFQSINRAYYRLFNFIQANFPKSVKNILHPFHTAYRRGIVSTLGGKDEYEKGMDPEVRRRLEEVYVDDVQRLEEYTGRNFEHWFEYPDAAGYHE
jgi:hypothetical protein